MLVQPADAADERHLRVRFRFARRRPRSCGSSTSGCSAACRSRRRRCRAARRDRAHRARPARPGVRRRRVRGAACAARTSGIKRILLDQRLISGVGNIYADEALWLARLHGERPRRPAVPAPTSSACSAAARTVMTEALGQGGTSFDALYVNVNGESGYFDRSLEVYGREGEPCRRCGTPIRRDRVHEPLVVLLPRRASRPRAARRARRRDLIRSRALA